MKQIILKNGIQQNIPTNELETMQVIVELQKKNNNISYCLDNHTETFLRIEKIKKGIKENNLSLTMNGFYLLSNKISNHYGKSYFEKKIIKYCGNGGGMLPLIKDMEQILIKELNNEYPIKKYGLEYI